MQRCKHTETHKLPSGLVCIQRPGFQQQLKEHPKCGYLEAAEVQVAATLDRERKLA